jgi:hypothetical protein
MRKLIRGLAIAGTAAVLGMAGVATAAYASGTDTGVSGSGSGGGGGGSGTSGGGSGTSGGGGGGGGGGSSSTTTPVLCGDIGVGVDGIEGYYGDQGFFVASTFANCGNVKTVYFANFTDTTSSPGCTFTIPSMGTKLISLASTQSFTPGVIATAPNFGVCPMPSTVTFRIDLYAQPNVFLRSKTWTINPATGATIGFS